MEFLPAGESASVSKVGLGRAECKARNELDTRTKREHNAVQREDMQMIRALFEDLIELTFLVVFLSGMAAVAQVGASSWLT
jgi:hypothetical protein